MNIADFGEGKPHNRISAFEPSQARIDDHPVALAAAIVMRNNAVLDISETVDLIRDLSMQIRIIVANQTFVEMKESETILSDISSLPDDVRHQVIERRKWIFGLFDDLQLLRERQTIAEQLIARLETGTWLETDSPANPSLN